MLKNGEHRQFNPMCPFDCTDWDECVCENTAIRDGTADGKCFFTADEIIANSKRGYIDYFEEDSSRYTLDSILTLRPGWWWAI